MGTYVLIDLLWAGGSVAPAQPTILRWNWGIFAQICSTCLEGPYRSDSSGAHPCRTIDMAWEPRIPSPCSLKAITHATGSKIGNSRSSWNRGTEYYPVGMKTYIEYPDIFFWKYNSPYHIEMGTYVLILVRAWEPRIRSPCSLKAITHATGSKIRSSQSH